MTDLKQLWQDQTTEGQKMTLEEIRNKAIGHRRQEKMVGAITLPLSLLFTLYFVRLAVLTPKAPLLLPIGVGLYTAYLGVKFLRAKPILPNAGLKTSLDAYREHIETEHYLFPRIWAVMGLLLAFGGIGAVKLWFQARVFPVRDAALFTLSYVLIGIVVYLAFIYERKKLARERRKLEDHERDAAE